MTIPEAFHGGLRIDPPVVGEGLSSIGGPMFVLNEDAVVVTEGYGDPYAALNSESSAHAEVRPIIVPDFGLYLMLWCAWTGDGVTLSTPPKVRIFGKTPDPQEPIVAGGDRRLWPQDIDDTVWPDLSTLGFWHPLQNPDNAETVGILLAAAAHMSYDVQATGFAAMHLTERYFVYLAGCKQVLCTIDDAAVLSATGEAMIVGRFVG